jgi:glycosyltransferase involved in cell wall biosynthesis
MITTFYPPYNFGGDGIFVRRLSNELARRGHQVDVIHCIDAYRLLAHQELARTYDDHPNVTVHGLKSPFGFLSPLATQQMGLPFFKSARIQQILEKGFDVIHYHNISRNTDSALSSTPCTSTGWSAPPMCCSDSTARPAYDRIASPVA